MASKRPASRGAGRAGKKAGVPDKFKGKVRERFLAELAETGRWSDSCQAAGVSYHTMAMYREGGVLEDLDFQRQCDAALEQYTDKLRREAHRRAVEGWKERGIYDKDGNEIGEVVKYSDGLLLALLKRHDHGFRERLDVEAKGTVSHRHEHRQVLDLEQAARELSPEGRAHLRALLEEMAAARARPVEEGSETSRDDDLTTL